jgi:hypothetical protein
MRKSKWPLRCARNQQKQIEMDSYSTKASVDRVSSSKMLITTCLDQPKMNSHKEQVKALSYQIAICFSKHSAYTQMQFEVMHIG